MRIAFVSQPWDRGFPPSDSLSVISYEIARRLADLPAAHEVIVYARGESRDERHDDITYRYLPSIVTLRAVELLQRVARRAGARSQPFASPFAHLDYALQVARDLRRHPCDLILVHNFSQFVPFVRRANPRARIFLYMHCEWLNQLDPSVIARRLRLVDRILGCSEYVTAKARRALPEFADRCATLYYGVDTDKFSPPERPCDSRPRRLVFVSRISPEKGVHVLLEAFAKVVERVPDAELDIVGQEARVSEEMLVAISEDGRVRDLRRFYHGSYLETLQRDYLTDKSAAGVRFPGLVPHAHVADYYRAADVFVVPSLSDMFPVGHLEAMATGLPQVVTKVGGLPESVVHESNGLQVEPDDAQAFADALLRLLEDPERWRRMGAEARRRAVEVFSWERTARGLLRHYEESSKPRFRRLGLEPFGGSRVREGWDQPGEPNRAAR